jgi:aerobic-type carbon monoxide dehydrogenase small subunit (CoxS/CutS family)
MKMEGTFIINGLVTRAVFSPDAVLLTILRENGFTEVKEGCREGECGACLVLLDGKLVNSCQVLAGSAVGKEITTVKGIGNIHFPHPIQSAFADTGAVQCGFCTPGMVLAAFYLLNKNPDPDDDEIRRALDGNLCRCTGYVKIIEAVRLAAKRMSESQPD